MVLRKWFVVFGRIVVPSSSGSSGVWLDLVPSFVIYVTENTVG